MCFILLHQNHLMLDSLYLRATERTTMENVAKGSCDNLQTSTVTQLFSPKPKSHALFNNTDLLSCLTRQK